MSERDDDREKATRATGYAEMALTLAPMQPPRTCSTCSVLSAAGSCMSAAESGERWPDARKPRRCLSYLPEYGSYDSRTGFQLWPEAVNQSVERLAEQSVITLPPKTVKQSGHLVEIAERFLIDALAHGRLSSSEVISHGTEIGIGKRTLQRAAERLMLIRTKTAFSGGWLWALPQCEGDKAQR